MRLLQITWFGVGLDRVTANSSRSKASGSSDSVVELLGFNNLGVGDFFDDKLGDSITNLYLEVLVRMVEEDHSHYFFKKLSKNFTFSSVVLIDDSSPSIDEILHSESGTRS